MTHPITTAATWGAAGMLAGAGTATALLLPFYPESDVGFEELGWYPLWMALGLAGGAWALHSGLRRVGARHVGRTVVA